MTQIIVGDARSLPWPDQSVQCVVTSPPYYGLRDYGISGQLGHEQTPDEYVANLVAVFREVRRVLKDDGTAWLNLGDSYAQGGSGGASPKSTLMGYTGDHVKLATMQGKSVSRKAPPGLKPKDLIGIPWRVALALQADGWYLRSDIIWAKPNPMPESVRDRPTRSHEYVFLLTKSSQYKYDSRAIAEQAVATRNRGGNVKMLDATGIVLGRRDNPNGGLGRTWEPAGTRNCRSVWTISPQPFRGAHFAVMPQKLVERCIMAGSAPGDTVMDPFAGSGTVPLVAHRLGRVGLGVDLNPEYVAMANARLDAECLTSPGKPLNAA